MIELLLLSVAMAGAAFAYLEIVSVRRHVDRNWSFLEYRMQELESEVLELHYQLSVRGDNLPFVSVFQQDFEDFEEFEELGR